MKTRGIRKKTVRFLTLMLTLVLTVGMLPLNALAAGTVNYTVEHYLQEADGATYTLQHSYTQSLSGDAGSIAAGKELDELLNTGFTVKTPREAAVLKEGVSTVLKVYYDRKQYSVYFDVNGGEYFDDSYVNGSDSYDFEPYSTLYGTALTAPGTPKRAGYAFDGWTFEYNGNTYYNIADISTVITTMTMPAEDLRLAANWTPVTSGASYTILYWLEDPDNPGTYEYYDSQIVTGATAEDYITDTTLDSCAAAKLPGTYVSFLSTNKYFTYYNETKTEAELYDDVTNTYTKVAIAGDGSATVNVYYDWNTYTLTFSDTYGLKLEDEILTAPYTITAKYGAYIGDLWPDSTVSAPDGQYFYQWQNYYYNTATVYYFKDSASTMMWHMLRYYNSGAYYAASNTISPRFTSTTPQDVTIHRMLQSLDFEDSGVYEEIISSYNIIAGTTLSVGAPSGFTVIGGAYDNDPGNLTTSNNMIDLIYGGDNATTDIYMFYSRNSYKITFSNNDASEEKTNVKYEADISEYGSEPAHPSGVDDDYEFGGWYTTAQCIGDTEFDFTDAAMPAGNLILYAKWIKPEYTVTFNPANGDVETVVAVDKYNTAMEPSEIPVRDGYTFAGWHVLDKSTEELSSFHYVFDFPVTDNVTLVAKWTIPYKVHVVVEDEHGNTVGELPEKDANLNVIGETDENGELIIEPPYDLDGYGVYETEYDEGNDEYIVIYRPISENPEINELYEGDIVVSGTGEPGAEIEVGFDTDGDGEPDEFVTTTVDENGNWSVLVPDGVTLEEGDVVTAVQTEDGKVPSDPAEEIVAADNKSEQSEKPDIGTIRPGDDTVSGTGVPGAVVIVEFPDGSQVTAVVDEKGNWTVDVPDGVTLSADDNVTAIQIEPGKTPSDEAEQTVINKSNPTPMPTTPTTPDNTDSSEESGDADVNEGERTESGYIIGGGSGRDRNNPYDTITIIGEEDVPLGWLVADDHMWYVNGYPDGSVRPEGSITRAEAAMIFYRLLDDDDKLTPAPQAFSDVSADAWYGQSVNYLASAGLLSGYQDGTFRPNAPITRAEYAAMASKYARLILTTGTAFSDVPEDHWAVAYINSAYVRGWVDGYEDYSFKPEQSITRAEVVKQVNMILERNPSGIGTENPYNDITSSHWAYIHMLEASIVHSYGRDENGIEYWME